MRHHRIATPHRLVQFLAKFYAISQASVMMTIRTARGDGLAPGTDLQDLHILLITVALRYRVWRSQM